jgi:curli biogenesis system outer membrane secretion channel CsgG
MFNKFSILAAASASLLIATNLIIGCGVANISPATATEKAAKIEMANPDLVSLNISRSKKPRIAVLDFEYSSISSQWSPWLQTNIKGVSDILVNKLVDGGNFSAIERSQLDRIIREQNLGATQRLDASSAAKIGRILGVKTIIIGSVTQFDIDKQSNGFSVPFLGSVGGGKTSANVRINMRAVDTKTAEILFTAQGDGSSDRNDNSINIKGFSMGSGSSNQESKLLSTATADAIEQIANKINGNPTKIIDTE